MLQTVLGTISKEEAKKEFFTTVVERLQED
jgi:hypothetical protein